MKDILLITCSCGCDSTISFKYTDGIIYVGFSSSDFYLKQNTFENLRVKFNLLRNKNILKEIMVEKDELIELKNFLLSHTYNPDVKFKNSSRLKVEYDYFPFIELFSTINKHEIIRNKFYRGYELMINQEIANDLIKQINEVLDICQRKECNSEEIKEK